MGRGKESIIMRRVDVECLLLFLFLFLIPYLCPPLSLCSFPTFVVTVYLSCRRDSSLPSPATCLLLNLAIVVEMNAGQRCDVMLLPGPLPEDQIYKERSSELYHLFWNSRYTDDTDMFWREHYIK